MHYKRGWFTGYRSLIDDSAFFLAKNGQRDRHAELEATIAAILDPDVAKGDDHAQCRFPARTRWLTDKMPELKTKLPKVSCPKYDEAYKVISPTVASLVFPSTNMSGPASMFGHTMLRLERDNTSPLLGYAITYAADATDAGVAKYIVYGLFGGFDGVYSVKPYSAKLTEYSAIELRDVWEYRLKLSPAEVQQMYAHIWEMSLVKSDYYFFDENCSYNLLFLAEAAREGIHLTDGYITVVPIDTVKDIRRAGLIDSTQLRPSRITTIQAIAGAIPASSVALAEKIANKDTSATINDMFNDNCSDIERADILNLAYELVMYNSHSGGLSPEELRQYQNKLFAISSAIARLPVRGTAWNVSQLEVSPDMGHDSKRVSIGAGYGGDSPYISTNFRASYHSPDDNEAGYRLGVYITLGELSLRYYTEKEHFSLNKFAVLDVLNLYPLKHFQRGFSWGLSAGVRDSSIKAEESEYAAYWNLGGGFSIQLSNAIIWAFAYAELASDNSSSGVLFGSGGRLGVIAPITDNFKLMIDGRHLTYTDSSEHSESNITAKLAIYPAINHALVFDANYTNRKFKDTHEDDTSAGLTYSYFF
ncbi:membrane protein [Deferribacterales bacterium]|nr:membrane protein [Deferribacterales bacterium]